MTTQGAKSRARRSLVVVEGPLVSQGQAHVRHLTSLSVSAVFLRPRAQRRLRHHCLVGHKELRAHPDWRRTGDAYFPVAARVGEAWWVLRINNFPDHPVWTLLVDGVRRFDLDDAPAAWGDPANRSLPSLEATAVEEALAPVREFTAYGSEVGQPCTNLFCCG